jgi:hypothetical protein
MVTVNREVLDNGTITYRMDDNRLHRANGPAMEWFDAWEWVLYDNWHRYYGPQDQSGDWWIHDMRIK